MACLNGRAKTKESAKSVLEQLIAEEDKSIRAPSTHEVVEGIIDNLNQVCTRKVMEELSKTEAAQSGCSGRYHHSQLISSDGEGGRDAGI